MKPDHRTVYQKFCENKGKFWVLSKVQNNKLRICKVSKMGNSFPAKFKEGYYDL